MLRDNAIPQRLHQTVRHPVSRGPVLPGRVQAHQAVRGHGKRAGVAWGRGERQGQLYPNRPSLVLCCGDTIWYNNPA